MTHEKKEGHGWEETSVDAHPFLSKARDEGELLGLAEAQRYFTPTGRAWPLFSIALYRRVPSAVDGVTISTTCKMNAGAWMENCALPVALAPRLVEMLEALSP